MVYRMVHRVNGPLLDCTKDSGIALILVILTHQQVCLKVGWEFYCSKMKIEILSSDNYSQQERLKKVIFAFEQRYDQKPEVVIRVPGKSYSLIT